MRLTTYSLPVRLIAVIVLVMAAQACSQDPVSENDQSPFLLESIATSGAATCGLTPQAELYCWGAPQAPVVQRDTTADCASRFFGCNVRPRLVTTGLAFREIRMSLDFIGHLCGLTETNEMYCWGEMLVTFDFLADVGRTPTRHGPAEPILAMSTGSTHDCALTIAGDTYCWGDYDFNVRATGGPVQHDSDFVPNLVAGGWTFQSLAAAWSHSCGLEQNGEALCWGNPERVGLANPPIRTGECGLPLTCVDHPVRVAGFRQFRQLASGGRVTCGIDGIQQLFCWGDNALGAVGDGTTIDRTEPVQVDLPGGVTSVAAGANHTCATTTRGTTYCWGSNYVGQLGTGEVSDFIPTPTAVNTHVPLLQLAGGFEHTCALDDTGAAWCWGRNWLGQLGTGDTLSSAVPRQVVPPRM